jgi:hypothetical protein
MNRLNLGIATIAVTCVTLNSIATAAPTVYPTGVTIFEPAQTWNGFTVLTPLGPPNVAVIDMNGKLVKIWEGYNNSAGGPARVLPNGEIIGASGANPGHQESLMLIQQDFNGKEQWRLLGNEDIQAGGSKQKSLRQHHDWQREDFPAGYYSPAFKPKSTGSNTLVLTHLTQSKPDISIITLEDDRIIEYAADGKISWQWTASEHAEEFGLSKEARAAIKAGAGAAPNAKHIDWVHINSATYVGPNHWFDEGDKRFAPNNVIISSRQASFVAIISRDGKIVWRIGPDFSTTPEQRKIGQIIGQHHAHVIPTGLPGAGNMMIFDNGGSSGYGYTNPIALNGYGAYARATSRILEINPVTLELVWSYTAANFFATNISGVQRLPNGNTLITEGPSGRVFEVTSAKKIVWEYISQFLNNGRGAVYRAYRIPYDWMPQVKHAVEKAVIAPPLAEFMVLPQ